jgi:hypothetical protein
VGVVAPRRFGPRERVDRLDVSEWLRLALRPGESAEVEVTEIEPTLLDTARLAGLDAVCLPRPDLLTAPHWGRVRLFLEGGGLLLVMPPGEVQVHLWSDAMVKELGLGWSVAREAKTFPPDTPATIAPVALTGTERVNVLAKIQEELDVLARPVNVWRVLPVELERGEGRRLLSLSDGTPLLIAEAFGGVAGAGTSDGPNAAGVSPSRPSDRGLIVFLAASPELEWTDLPAKPLMVPLVQEIIKEGIGRAHGSWWSIAGNRPATPSRSAELHAVELSGAGMTGADKGESRDGLVAVDEAGTTSVPLRRAGLWRAVDERGAGRGIVAVNPDTRGSRTRAQDAVAVAEWLGRAAFDSKVTWINAEEGAAAGAGEGPGGIASLLARESSGSPISLPLLIAALVIAVIELWMARWASHAEVPAASVRGKGAVA